MTKETKAPPRKNVGLPPDVLARVDEFRRSQNISSESDALRRLIEMGLNFFDRPADLFRRCTAAHAEGAQVGELISSFLTDHPLVSAVNINQEAMTISLTNHHEIILDRYAGQWRHMDERNNEIGYFPARGLSLMSDDEEIPF